MKNSVKWALCDFIALIVLPIVIICIGNFVVFAVLLCVQIFLLALGSKYKVVTYKCPNCGAKMQGSDKETLKCDYCKSEFSKQQLMEKHKEKTRANRGTILLIIGFAFTILVMFFSWLFFFWYVAVVLTVIQAILFIIGLIMTIKNMKKIEANNILQYISLGLYVIGALLYFLNCRSYNIYLILLIISSFIALISIIKCKSVLTVIVCVLAIIFVVTMEIITIDKSFEQANQLRNDIESAYDTFVGCLEMG